MHTGEWTGSWWLAARLLQGPLMPKHMMEEDNFQARRWILVPPTLLRANGRARVEKGDKRSISDRRVRWSGEEAGTSAIKE